VATWSIQRMFKYFKGIKWWLYSNTSILGMYAGICGKSICSSVQVYKYYYTIFNWICPSHLLVCVDWHRPLLLLPCNRHGVTLSMSLRFAARAGSTNKLQALSHTRMFSFNLKIKGIFICFICFILHLYIYICTLSWLT
jgi:hypothetical protein